LLALSPCRASGCLTCHKDTRLAQKAAGKQRKLVLDIAALKRSVHADLDCTDCHTQLSDAEEGKAHKAKLGPPSCNDCHEEASKAYDTGVHARANARGKRGAALCGDCHGAHDIVKVKSPRSRVYKRRLPYTCAKCHKTKGIAARGDNREPSAASHYVESIHGHALLRDGLIVAPSCTDCHGSHAIHRSNDPRSPIHHSRVPHTCKKCHEGIDEVYDRSVHGKLLARGDPRGPVCNDCHTAHKISKPHEGIFKLASDERCGRCHQDRLKRYRETYHGKAIALGQSKVAACHDCHGHHDVLPASDPRSRLSKGKILATCQRCHPDAEAGFTGYMAHGDHSDKKNYPRIYWAYTVMTTLLLVVFALFGLHSALWFLRSLVLLIRDPRAFHAARRRARTEVAGKIYTRFRPVDRFCHVLVIVSFLLLVLTGMPLKFYEMGWARWIFSWMGGSEVAAALHRLGAVITLVYFAVHLGSLAGPLWRNRGRYRDDGGAFRLRRLLGFAFGPDSPLPNWQDLRDFWAHQKWFFGRGPRPQFDRWTYWEKFDYLAVFWGVAVIGLSGLVMWYPEAATRYLPGWVINVALVIHSDEALLAAAFIFTFHFFNVHFRVEKFPIDPVIFSGRITEAELLHERRRLYDRLESQGRLADEKVKDEWPRWRRIFVPFGMLAFGLGVVLAVGIYLALASRLL
jgi:cytochrome b subunit of formate dehydrogenase